MLMITFHGCERDLVGAMWSHQEAICPGLTNACYNITREDIVDPLAISKTACFCEGDL